MLQVGRDGIRARNKLVESIQRSDQVRAKHGPRFETRAQSLQGWDGFGADFLDCRLKWTGKLLVADNLRILLRQWLAMTACNLKVGIGHAEFLFDDRGGVGAHEQEEVPANIDLRLHPTGRIDADIGDGPHERAKKVNLRALPDAGSSALGQLNPQSNVADEPALAAPGQDQSGDEHADQDQDERARNCIDVPEFKALLSPVASIIVEDVRDAGRFVHG